MNFKQLLSTSALLLIIATSSASAQTIVNDIKYTLSDDGTYYIVSGISDGIEKADIASEINGISVTTIKAGAFSKNTSLREAVIPSSITNIGNSIFQNCTSLEKVTFEPGENALSMGGWVFNNCSSLKEVVLPARLEEMTANSNFNGCASLEKVVFESGNKKLSVIPQYTFANTALTELDMSGLESLYTFYPNVVQGVTTTLKVTMSPSQNLQYLPQKMFTNVNATEIIYPEGTKSIVRNAFNGYTKVKTISLPSTLETIEPKAFMNCSSIDLISIPKTVTSIGESAFGYEAGKGGPKCVIMKQEGGQWPAESDIDISGADTKVYCYKDITDIPSGITTVAPIIASRYTTYYSSTAIRIPEGVSAGVITGITGGEMTIYYKYNQSDILPQSTAVLIKSDLNDISLYPEIIPANTSVYSGINYLKGSENAAPLEIGNTNYILKESDGAYCFEIADAGTTDNLPNHAYLSLPSSLSTGNTSFPLEDTVTGINDIILDLTTQDGPVYNLQGLKVNRNNLTPGIYISNGKKFIVK